MLSIALGVGVNTAIYSFMDAIFMRSLPVQNPASLVGINWHTKDRPTLPRGAALFYSDPRSGFIGVNFPVAFFDLLRTHDDIFSSVFAFSSYGAASLTLNIHGQSALADSVCIR